MTEASSGIVVKINVAIRMWLFRQEDEIERSDERVLNIWNKSYFLFNLIKTFRTEPVLQIAIKDDLKRGGEGKYKLI